MFRRKRNYSVPSFRQNVTFIGEITLYVMYKGLQKLITFFIQL